MEENSSFGSFEFQLGAASRDFLKTASGWAMFLSIIGFIFTALGLLASLAFLFAGNSMAPASSGMMMIMSGSTFGLFFIIFVLLTFVPVLYLFKFSSSVRQALSHNNTEVLTKAFSSLKNYFLWAGILTIFYIVSYIGFVILAASAAVRMGSM